jgi:hypothetical protein
MRKEVLRGGGGGRTARRSGEQRGSDRREVGTLAHAAHHLYGRDRRTDHGDLRDRGCTEPTAEAVIRVVHRARVMMVIRVGAGLIRRMGEDPPVGLCCGTGPARPAFAFEAHVELMECRRHQPREIEREEQSCPVLDTGRSAGSKSQATRASHATHATNPACDSHPAPGPREWGFPPDVRGMPSDSLSRTRRRRKASPICQGD